MSGELAGDGAFRTTRWSVVAAAGRADTPSARDALEVLCRAYWYPLYLYVRRRGRSADEASDLVQGFFARLLERRDLAAADPERGRFRAFLRTALEHHLANERDRERALKRGGGARVLSLDLADAEGRLAAEPQDGRTPESAFDRTWALAVMERALARVAEEYQRAGRGPVFERLAPCLSGSTDLPYRELARQVDLTEGAFKVAVHRARTRFRDALRREVADTLRDPAEVDRELADLLAALS